MQILLRSQGQWSLLWPRSTLPSPTFSPLKATAVKVLHNLPSTTFLITLQADYNIFIDQCMTLNWNSTRVNSSFPASSMFMAAGFHAHIWSYSVLQVRSVRLNRPSITWQHVFFIVCRLRMIKEVQVDTPEKK